MRDRALWLRVLILSLSVLLPSWAVAADPFVDLGLGGLAGGAHNSADYSGQITPERGIAGPNTTPSVIEQQVRGSVIIRQDTTDTWSLSTKGALFRTDSQFVIPTESAVPQNLYDISVGASYSHKIEKDPQSPVERQSFLNFNVGSASDAPSSVRDMYFQSTFAYKFQNANHSVMAFVNESTNRPFLNFIPIPGIVYLLHDPKSGFDAALGLPFAFANYHPFEHWNFRASIFGPTTMMAEAAYLISPDIQIYSAFNWGQQMWATESRPSYATRLFYDRKKAGMGFRSPFFFSTYIDLFGGWEFARRFYQADSALSNKETADMAASWFALLKLGVLSF